MWGVVFCDVMIVDKDVRVVVRWRRGVMVDDSGWLCVLKEVFGVLLSMGAWYGLWWVWLERCRDGSYAVNALCCDVWVVCAVVIEFHTIIFYSVCQCFWVKIEDFSIPFFYTVSFTEPFTYV